MAYKACFACELLFEVDLGLGESTRCPQCGGVLSDYDPSADELDGKARDVAPAPTQANQAIVRTMSYKGLADAVKAQIGSHEISPSGSSRPAPRARGPVPRPRTSDSLSSVPRRSPVPARPGTLQGRPGGLIPARAPLLRPRPVTDAMKSMGGDAEPRRATHTAPIGSINASADELLDDTPLPEPAMPRAVRPAPLPARSAVPAADAPRGTKVLDAVDPDGDETALDAAGAAVLEHDSMVEDISMMSMHEDGSVLDDISMHSMVEGSADAAPALYDLPATVAIVQDPARPLPAIPGAAPKPAAPAPRPVAHVDPLGATEARPAPSLPPIGGASPQPVAPRPAVPQPVGAQPVAPRPAMPQPVAARPLVPQPVGASPIAAQPVAPRPAMPQPVAPRPASPFGAAPAPAGPAAPTDDEPSVGASAFAPVDFDHAAARRSGSKAPLIIALVVVLLGAAGAGVWFFVLRDSTLAADPEAAPPPPPELTWSEKLEQQIQAGQSPLPTVDSAAPLTESVWLAGGPEGMSTSLGLVTGMATSVIRQGAAQDDDSGSFLPVVQKKLAEGTPTAETLLLFGLPAEMTVVDFLRMADSGRRAGHGRFAMVVEEGAGSGKLSQLPFVLAPKDAPIPDKGIVKVRIGTLGLHITARDAEGARLPEGQAEGEPPPEPRVPLAAGALDLDGFAARLTALKNAQPEIERVVIHHAPEMKVGALAPLLARIYRGSEGKRFAEIALVP